MNTFEISVNVIKLASQQLCVTMIVNYHIRCRKETFHYVSALHEISKIPHQNHDGNKNHPD